MYTEKYITLRRIQYAVDMKYSVTHRVNLDVMVKAFHDGLCSVISR